MIRGVDPALEPQVSDVGRAHGQRDVRPTCEPGSQNIVLGAGLAWALDARIGDEITVLVPTQAQPGDGVIAGIDLQPRIQTFTVSGIFEVGAQEHDNVARARALAGCGSAGRARDGAPGGLRLKFADIFAAPARRRANRRKLWRAASRRATGRSRTPATSARCASRRP